MCRNAGRTPVKGIEVVWRKHSLDMRLVFILKTLVEDGGSLEGKTKRKQDLV
jgi:hypothetical protein